MDDEVRVTFRLINQLGLHTRAATLIAKTASRYASAIKLVREDRQARASSIIELLQLCGQPGAELQVIARGDDAEEAVKAIGDLIETRFGESE